MMYFIRDYDGPEIYQPGSNPDVLIVGQDPTVDKCRRFATVLGFDASQRPVDEKSRNLQRYLRSRILAALGINESRILATNLINFYYYDVPNRLVAKHYQDIIIATAKKEGIDTKQYPDKTNGAILHALNFKDKARQDFESLLKRPSIYHVITLGEPVFQVLRERYSLQALDPKINVILESMSDKPLTVQIVGKEVSLLPLPHIFNEHNPKWRFYKEFLGVGLPRLYTWYNR